MADHHELFSWSIKTHLESEFKTKLSEVTEKLQEISSTNKKLRKDLDFQLGRVKHAKVYFQFIRKLSKFVFSYFDYILRPIGTNASLSLTKLKRFMKNILMEKIMIPISNMISKKKTSYEELLEIKKLLSTVPSLSTINKFKLLMRFRLKFIRLIYQHYAGNC